MEYEEYYANGETFGWDHLEFEKFKKLIEEEVSFLKESIQIEEGIECARCKSKKTYTYQKQVRSADESTTSFTICFACEYQMIE